MTYDEISCSNCGAKDLQKLNNGLLKCASCKSLYAIETTSTGELKNIRIKHSRQKGTFAVHGKLKVTGCCNKIQIVSNALNAIHVADLNITGNMNKVTILLLDNASLQILGHFNKVY